MKIVEGCNVTTDNFWYDLADGGYIKPEEMLESKEDAEAVNNAVKVIRDFQLACEDQIEDFWR